VSAVQRVSEGDTEKSNQTYTDCIYVFFAAGMRMSYGQEPV